MNEDLNPNEAANGQPLENRQEPNETGIIPAPEKPVAEPLQVTIVPRKRRWWPWVLGVAGLALVGLVFFLVGRQKGYRDGLSVAVADSAYNVDGDTVDGWARAADYEQWRRAVFLIPQYDAIPESFKKGIVKIFMDNKYLGDDLNKDGIYFFTRIKDRAPKVFKFGHFTGAAELEMAFILEKDDYKSSALFIIPERGNVLFYKSLDNELPILKVIKRGETIFMGDINGKKAVNDAVYLSSGPGEHYAMVYNAQTKTFEKYHQYSPQELKDIKYDNEHGDDEGDESDTTEVDTTNRTTGN